MRQHVSRTQQRVLDAIRTLRASLDRNPTERELAAHVGLGRHGWTTIGYHLRNLETLGKLRLIPQHRAIILPEDELPVVRLGPVAADQDLLDPERVVARILRESLLAIMFSSGAAASRLHRSSYLAEAIDDTMDRAGIRHGHRVAITESGAARNGDIVVARLDDTAVLRRYAIVDRRQVELQPESTKPIHQPVRLERSDPGWRILGRMTGAFIGVPPQHVNWPSTRNEGNPLHPALDHGAPADPK